MQAWANTSKSRTDGFVVIDVSKKQGLLTDSAGTHQSTFSIDQYQRLPAVSRDGNKPSTADSHDLHDDEDRELGDRYGRPRG